MLCIEEMKTDIVDRKVSTITDQINMTDQNRS